jgi:hypothetical protein
MKFYLLIARIASVVTINLVVAVIIVPITFGLVSVGVGTGKIVVDESVKPGGIYNLPPLTIFNNGDEKTDYGIETTFNETQAQLKPETSWFNFSPATFTLEPQKTQTVHVQLTVPVNTHPGDYFAYLEAHPVVKANAGSTSIGIAAATKLSFSVVASTPLQAVLYRISSLFTNYAPWSGIILSMLIFGVIVMIFRKFFHFHIGIEKKSDGK